MAATGHHGTVGLALGATMCSVAVFRSRLYWLDQFSRAGTLETRLLEKSAKAIEESVSTRSAREIVVQRTDATTISNNAEERQRQL